MRSPAVSPIVHAQSAQMGIGERENMRGWGQQLVVRGQLHSPMGKLVMRVAHVAPIRARCFNSKRTSFHVALELEHVESVDLRSAIRKADAVLPAFAREGQRGHTVKSASRGAAGVVCCFYSGCNTSATLLLGFLADFGAYACSLRVLEVIMFLGRDQLRAKEGVTCIRESNHHRLMLGQDLALFQ